MLCAIIRWCLGWFWLVVDLGFFPLSIPFRRGGFGFCCSLVAFVVWLSDQNSKPALVIFLLCLMLWWASRSVCCFCEMVACCDVALDFLCWFAVCY